MPIFERFGGRLVKVEADDLFIVFPATRAELAIRAVLRCMKVQLPSRHQRAASFCMHASAWQATREFSEDKPRNSQIIIAAGIIAGPMYLLPGLDVFGGCVPLGFRVGEDETPNGMLYVHESVKTIVDGLGTAGLTDPTRPIFFDQATEIEGDACDGRKHTLFTVRVEKQEPTTENAETSTSTVMGYTVAEKKGLFGILSQGSRSKVTPEPEENHEDQRRSKQPSPAARFSVHEGERKEASMFERLIGAMGDIAETKELALLRKARLKPKWCLTNSVINSEEPQELMLMMSGRIQCNTPEARAYCDKHLLERFARRAATVLVVVVDIQRPAEFELREQARAQCLHPRAPHALHGVSRLVVRSLRHAHVSDRRPPLPAPHRSSSRSGCYCSSRSLRSRRCIRSVARA